ncbi:hypothetical protein B484DRAFT_390535 [Ochromonadaceae sp. CCMP2298]|nr:hypothetical protein B484DRAFT_390535 [Ochromonadaceae sp. CCMP2298]
MPGTGVSSLPGHWRSLGWSWTLVVLSILSLSDADAACPAGFQLHDETCYHFEGEGAASMVLYGDCHNTCTHMGATMLCVQDDAQNDWIYENGRNGRTMLGLDKSSGTIVWPEGCTSTYTNWEGTQGAGGTGEGGGAFGSIGVAGRWNDIELKAYCACQTTWGSSSGFLPAPTAAPAFNPFSGFKSLTPSSAPAPPSNPFASFSGLPAPHSQLFRQTQPRIHGRHGDRDGGDGDGDGDGRDGRDWRGWRGWRDGRDGRVGDGDGGCRSSGYRGRYG